MHVLRDAAVVVGVVSGGEGTCASVVVGVSRRGLFSMGGDASDVSCCGGGGVVEVKVVEVKVVEVEVVGAAGVCVADSCKTDVDRCEDDACWKVHEAATDTTSTHATQRTTTA